MTLTVQNTTLIGSHIGPGYVLDVHISAGPIPNDDFVTASVRPAGSANFICSGVKRTNGSLNPKILMGYTDGSLGIADGQNYFVASGATVELIVNQYHAGLTLVDTLTLTGWTWEPTAGLHALISKFGNQSPGALAEVLAAVKRTFPATS